MHYTYRVIPDFKLTTQALEGIHVLIVPHVRAMDAETLDSVLKPFLDRGGFVLYTGADTASIGTKAHLYSSNSVTMAEFGLRYPSRVQRLSGNPGFEYFAGRRGASGSDSAAALEAIKDAITRVATRDSAMSFIADGSLNSTWGQTVRAT